MADKKINELPDESLMTTDEADKMIFIGDPLNGKLYHGLKGEPAAASKFGKADEDDTAGEDRLFDINIYDFNLHAEQIGGHTADLFMQADGYIELLSSGAAGYTSIQGNTDTTLDTSVLCGLFANSSLSPFNYSFFKAVAGGNAYIATHGTGKHLNLVDYGTGTKSGTAAYYLGVDSSGNVVETPTGMKVTTVNSTTGLAALSGADYTHAILYKTDDYYGAVNGLYTWNNTAGEYSATGGGYWKKQLPAFLDDGNYNMQNLTAIFNNRSSGYSHSYSSTAPVMMLVLRNDEDELIDYTWGGMISGSAGGGAINFLSRTADSTGRLQLGYINNSYAFTKLITLNMANRIIFNQGLSDYADNTAALAGGLTAGMLYKTTDTVKIVH